MPSEAQPVNDQTKSLVTLWSKSAPPLPEFFDLARSPAGVVVAIGEDSARKWLLLGLEATGPGRLVPLPGAAQTQIQDLRLALGDGETLWIGGLRHTRYTFSSARLSDAYLAKLDRSGQLQWERDLGGQSERAIQSLAALPPGDVVVAGYDDNATWLARISVDGRVLWERTFGLTRAAAVATVADKIVVAAFDKNEKNVGEEDLSVWRFDGSGNLLDHHLIERVIGDRHEPVWFIRLVPEQSDGSAYIFSLWADPIELKVPLRTTHSLELKEPLTAAPLHVIKLDSQSQVVWRKELNQNVLTGRSGPRRCLPPTDVLASGDALIACPTDDGIVLSQLDSMTGGLTQILVQRAPSPCEAEGTKFVIRRSNNILWMFGETRTCTWLGQVPLGN
jgi:hypothetical protein